MIVFHHIIYSCNNAYLETIVVDHTMVGVVVVVGGIIIIIRDIIGRVFFIKIFIEFLAGLLYLLYMYRAGGCLVALSIPYMCWL